MTQSNNVSPHSTPNTLPLIRASELAQYSFCHKAWWLGSVQKIQPRSQTNLARGRRVHARHGHQVKQAVRWRLAGFLLIGAGSLFLILALLGLWWGGGG